MAFGEMGIELAKLRANDLRDEGHRVGHNRRSQSASGRHPFGLHARAQQLVHWFRHGQLGTGIEDLRDAPIAARGRCA